MDNHTRMALEPTVGPDIVIADEEMYGNLGCDIAKGSDYGFERSKMALVGPEILHPEIKHIAQEVDGLGIALHPPQEGDEPLLVLLGVFDHERTKMDIADEVYHGLWAVSCERWAVSDGL